LAKRGEPNRSEVELRSVRVAGLVPQPSTDTIAHTLPIAVDVDHVKANKMAPPEGPRGKVASMLAKQPKSGKVPPESSGGAKFPVFLGRDAEGEAPIPLDFSQWNFPPASA
jgi:hypothetical protein